MNKLLKTYEGKLTYSMAVVLVVFSLGALIFKWVDVQLALILLWSGLTTFGIRRAVGKSTNNQ